MRRTWAVAAAMVVAAGLGARSSQAQSAPSAPAGTVAAPAPTVAGNSVVIPVPSASATVAGPSAKVVAPSATVAAPSATVATAPPMLMVPQPASANGQVPNGYVMLVPWTPPAPTPVAPPAMIERSYTNKLVFADLSALGLLLLAVPIQKPELAGVGVGVYALGAPVMHLTEGNVAKGAASLALRVGMPVGGFYVGAVGCLLVVASQSGKDLGDLLGCLVVGSVTGLAGVAGAVAIDYNFLGKEKVPATQPKGVSWSPTIRPSKDGMTLGVVGAW